MSAARKQSSDNWTIDSLVKHVSEIVTKESGNVLGEGQHSMVLSRLKKRLIDLGNFSPNDYFNHLKSNYKTESSHLVTILTTHHTFFFREFGHFEFMLKNLGSIVERAKARGENKIKVLSAACSRGQEVYSLAMFLENHLKDYPGMSYEIWGSDIDPESVKIASNGVYTYQEVKSIPQVYLTGHWQRGSGDIAHFARVKPHLKEKCNFGVMNLLNLPPFLGGKKFDLIFCRNVFIYFATHDIEKIVHGLKGYLHFGGYLVTGLSESLKSLKIDKETHAPSVYSFDKVETPKSEKGAVDIGEKKVIKPQTAVTSIIPTPVRILVVDDSSSVVKLLSKVFKSDPEFELVGTAMNGLEAQDFLKKNEVDAMTLDIHMPEMDGVEYLKKNFSKKHPNVVVVSSASREDTRYAQEALKNGACDFVEKPALNNLAERAEEIKNKLKMSFLNKASNKVTQLDKDFKKDFNIKGCDDKARVFFGSFSDREKIRSTLKDLKGEQPPTYIFFEGNGNFLDVIKEELKEVKNLNVFDGKTEKGHIYLCDFNEHSKKIGENIFNKRTSVSIFGICSQKVLDWVTHFKKTQLLIEDIPDINKDVKEVANDIFPWTSFSHIGTEFLSKE